MFGGKNLDCLYVTTSKVIENISDGSFKDSSSPNDGKLYMIKGKGLRFKGNCGRDACLQKDFF